MTTGAPGGAVGSLLIEERLASTASGDLLVARQPGLGRRVLVRTLRRDGLGGAWVERFRREARMAARVIHPNVQQAFDLFSWRGDHYLVLEYVAGESLRACLDQLGPPPAEVGLAIALEVARGLEALHAAGIVHADLRPENIRIGRFGEVKLSGLGWARGPAESDVGAPDPTPYAAPELAHGAAPDTRSDAFALGAVIGEILTGRVPPAPMRRPRALARLVRRALRTDPARRPEPRALRQELERALAEPSASAARARIAEWLKPKAQRPGPASGIERARSPRRWPARIAWAAVLGGITVGLVAVPFARRDPGSFTVSAPPELLEPPSVDAGHPAVSAPPPLEPARLRFAVFPWGEIRVDGGPPILTPSATATLLEPGEHRIEIVHPTLGRAVREVTLSPGEERVVRHVFDQVAAP